MAIQKPRLAKVIVKKRDTKLEEDKTSYSNQDSVVLRIN